MTIRPSNLVDEQLPPQYAAAQRLAERMLLAAGSGDWAEVSRLRTGLPALAAELRTAWEGRPAVTIEQEARRESLRLRAIGRVLSVDARIRELAQPWRMGLDQLMARPHKAQ